MRGDGNEAEKVCQKGKGKQSTLDNFVGIAKNKTEAIRVQENDAEESICNHHIDTESAKTWIYPGRYYCTGCSCCFCYFFFKLVTSYIVDPLVEEFQF